MKTQPGRRTDTTPDAANGTDAAGPRRPPIVRRLIVACALVALAAWLGFSQRHAMFGWLLTRSLDVVTGDRISIDGFHIGLTRSSFTGVRVTTAAGDPVIDAERVTLHVSLMALLSDRAHRWGVLGLDVDRPVFSLIRRADGSYNIGRGAPGGGSPAASGTAVPWNFAVHVRDGELRLIDDAPSAADLHEQRIVGIDLAAQLHSNRRSTATATATLLARRTAADAQQHWPLALGAVVDFPRGAAIARLRAPQLPIRGPLGFVQHSSAVRIDAGILHDFTITAFALGITPDRPLGWHLGGTGSVSAGRLTISALRRPVRDVRGRITLVDDGVWTTRLDADLAGVAIVARGGGYNRLNPTFRLGLSGDGDLHDLRRIFAFSQNQPVAGGMHVETLLEAPVSNLLIRSGVRVARGTYGRVPLSAVSGRVDYHAGTVILDGVRGRYGAVGLAIGARFLLGGAALDSAIVAAASAPGNGVPFVENVAPEAAVDALALITGGPAGYRARGALGLHGSGVAGTAMFAVDERGIGEFGPIELSRAGGSSLSGALRLERPTSRSAGWISARNYRINVPTVAARFPGLSVPAFPPVAGVLDGDLAGGGSPDRFALTGTLRGRDLRVGNAHLGSGHAELSGTLADVRLDTLAFDGPLGRFAGSGAAARGAFALRGAYDGSLEQLVPLTGPQQAHGLLRGDLLATLGDGETVVQSSDAVLERGSVRGVQLDAAAGTIAVRANRFHLLAATGSIMGRRAVAAETAGTIALSAPDIPAAALRGAGSPLDAGNVSAYGIADLRGAAPDFAGTVTVAGGRAHGYGVAGDAQLDLRGPRARVVAATGALGSTFGSIGGSIDRIGVGALRYDLDARVPLGDIDLLRRDLKVPVRHLAGTFVARLHVHGAGTRPYVDGRVDAPEGEYNGLAFRGAGAHLILDAFGAAARDATLTVGTTSAALEASAGGGAFSVSARATKANLADFNEYFDASDTLAGTGVFDLGLRTYGGRITSHGAVALQGLRYRDFALGETQARWATHGSTIAGTAGVRSAAGSLAAAASITPPAGLALLPALRLARYDARADFRSLDLGTWVPASGSSAPILGRLDARLRISGRLAQLVTTADATLSAASIRGFPVSSAHLRTRSNGSQINVLASDADLGFATLAGNGRLGLGKDDPLDFDLRVSTADVDRAARLFIPAARGLDLAGALDADVRLGGTQRLPKLAGGFDVRSLRYRGFVVPRAIGEVALVGRAIELRDADVEFTRGQAFVAGSLPLVLQPFGLGPPRAPLSFDVTARGVDLAQFAPLLPAQTALTGIVDGRFGVEGTVDRPRLLGSFAVSSGSYSSPLERAAIEHVGANVVFSGSSIALRTFHADVGGGTLDGSGRITLPIGAELGVRYQAELSAKSAKLDFPAYGHGTVDGTLSVWGSGTAPVIGGSIALRDAVIPVSAVYGNGTSGGGAAAGAAPLLNPAFKIHAAAGDNVRVRSSIVDIGVTGAVDLTGTLRAPQLAGGFSATDGTVSSYNHVFRIVDAAVTFNPADGIVPTIAARAISRVTNPDPDPSRNIAGSANIIVTVSGTADSNNLQVTYSSEPAYSQEQIIGLLLDVPALLGAVNFNLNGGAGGPLLRGAPGETNALLPPGVTPEQVSAISFNQEVFSLLNGQFTQRALNPVERLFEKTLGLSDVQFTVDYGGGIGYSLRRQLGKRDFYAFLSQTVTYPERVNLGFELVPKPFESLNFSFYQQNGVTSLITNQTPGEFFLSSTRRFTSVQPLGNRAGVSVNFSRRF